jgi:hypothetical protein
MTILFIVQIQNTDWQGFKYILRKLICGGDPRRPPSAARSFIQDLSLYFMLSVVKKNLVVYLIQGLKKLIFGGSPPPHGAYVAKYLCEAYKIHR